MPAGQSLRAPSSAAAAAGDSRRPCPGCGHANLPGSRFCNECGKPLATPSVASAGARVASELHAALPGREDPDLPPRARGRAQAGHGAVRRHEGLARAARRPRPGGRAQAPGPGPRAHDGGGAPLRGHRQPGHGRRHHGALRRPPGPRGPRRARLLRRPRHAAGHPPATPPRSGGTTASRSRSASASTPGEVVVRAIGSDLRMDYSAVGQTTHLAARMEQLATPGSTRLTGETLRLAEGFVQVVPIGPIPVKGMAAPGRGVRAGRTVGDAHAAPGGGGAGAHPLRGARPGARPPPPGPRQGA